MKKLITFITIAGLFVLLMATTYTPTSTKSYWWKNFNKFLNLPTLTNSGGTITDTLATQAYARQFGGGSGTDATAQTRIDSIVEALNDTVQLQTGISQLVYIIPPSATGTQISALVNPTEGALIWNTTDKHFYYFDGTNWQTLEKVAP